MLVSLSVLCSGIGAAWGAVSPETKKSPMKTAPKKKVVRPQNGAKAPLKQAPPPPHAKPAETGNSPPAPAPPPTQSSDSPQPAEPSEPALKEPQEFVFPLKEFVVEGNTLFPPEKLEQVLAKYRGPAQRVTDIEQARVALEKAYHTSGYPTVLVVTPEQTIEQGVVRLQVIESRLGQVRVKGNRYFSADNVLGKLPSLRSGAVLYEPTLLKELDTVNANPDRQVTPVLKPGKEFGTVDLDLKVKDRLPFHGRLEVNNRGIANTQEKRLNASVQYANLFDREHILSLQTTQTPEDVGEIEVYGFSYVAPVKGLDHLIAVYGAHSKSTSTLDGSALPVSQGSIGVAGNADVFGARFIFPVAPGGVVTHQVILGVDYKSLDKSEARFPGELGTALISNRVNYLPFSIGYTGLRQDRLGLTNGSLTLKGYVAGLVPGGEKEDFAGDPADLINKPGNRAGSTGTFGVVQAGLERVQNLPREFRLSAKVDGQWANEPLIAAEQYFAGGLDTVRGYVENEILGDHAVRGRVEILSPVLPEFLDVGWKAGMRAAVFYDSAYLWVRRPQPGQNDRFQIEGAGAGVRLKLLDYVQLHLDQAWALRDAVITRKGDSFTHFSVEVGF